VHLQVLPTSWGVFVILSELIKDRPATVMLVEGGAPGPGASRKALGDLQARFLYLSSLLFFSLFFLSVIIATGYEPSQWRRRRKRGHW
jgi:hypothetical protein